MVLRLLIEKFITERDDRLINVNQLLDFAFLCYLDNKYTISEYRTLLNELMLRGATKPDYYFAEEKHKAIV
ncbi:YppF family protein [Bacillaceae bacterium IKA-2]|nr:YppF family protein [Bacillaceae bacterium IKA-2]